MKKYKKKQISMKIIRLSKDYEMLLMWVWLDDKTAHL